mgnify:FL=1
MKSEGYVLLAISGSHQEIVEQVAKYYGFDDAIGTTYTRSNKIFSGEKFIASSDKKSNLEKLVQKHNLDFVGSYAIGDSHSDAAMLELVENPIAFNPDKELFEVAKSKNWNVVIERKNMIYELEPHDGHYILV